MSFDIFLNSTNINQYVLSYSREKAICDGIGRIELEVTKDLSTIKPWDELVIYENSQKVGTFYISTVTYKVDGASYSVNGQDGSKKLTDYFLTSKITPKDTIKYAKQLIQEVLNEVGVSYSFNVSGNGAAIAPSTEIGLQSAYEAVLSLVQQSGWYFYFDKNNVCRIGKLKQSLSNIKFTFTDENTIEFSYNYNDNSLRNKAIVWGGFDYQNNKEIFYAKRVKTPYDRHKLDIRSVVLSNAAIYSLNVAKYLANLMISEFSKLNKEKLISTPGFINVEVGDVVKIDLSFFKHIGIVTNIRVSVSNNGITTELLVDKRCPRIFAWFEWGTNPDYDDYVYVGTDGGGVKKKPIGKSGWSDFSSGLGNLTVKDLRIYAGNFICVAADGYAYTRTENTNWSKLNHGSFFDSNGKEYKESQVKAVSCAIDQVTGDFYVGYNYYEPYTNYTTFRSWVACFDSSRKLKFKLPVELYFSNRLLINDLDRHSGNTFIAGIGDISDFNKLGYRDIYLPNLAETTLPFIFGPQIFTTSGGNTSFKYEENNYLVPSGLYVYSGGFLSGDAKSLCTFIWEDDWQRSHTLYDNGRIFTIGNNHGLLIFDFTPSGITTRTGLVNKIPIDKLTVSGIVPPFNATHRFLYLDKKETHPELHALFIDDYGYNKSIYSMNGNSLIHFKYIFSDYSYTTISGSELCHYGNLVSKTSFNWEDKGQGFFARIIPEDGGVPGNFQFSKELEQDGIPTVFFDDGYLITTLYTKTRTDFSVFVLRYDVKTKEKRIERASRYYARFGEDVVEPDKPALFPLLISRIYPIPCQGKKRCFFVTAAVESITYKMPIVCKDSLETIYEDALDLFITAHGIIVAYDNENFGETSSEGEVEYTPENFDNETVDSISTANTNYKLKPVLRFTRKTRLEIDPVFSSVKSGNSCQDINDSCDDPYYKRGGKTVILMGTQVKTKNNRLQVLGQVLDEYGTTYCNLSLESNCQQFYYVPWVYNPCCYGEGDKSQPPIWCHRALWVNTTLIADADGIGVAGNGEPILENDYEYYNTNYLIVPSGYSPSFISAKKINRGYDFYINKALPGGGLEKISIPLFHEWDKGILDFMCNYIDFFDNTIYFAINAPWSGRFVLYGIDYNTGILKKNITGFNHGIQFGEKLKFVPPVIHNGILFRRGAFWIFNTTVSGYFVFPILYQNDIKTNIINIETVPTNVDVSKSFPYVTYSPFEYTLPTVSGSLITTSGVRTTKLYSIDFTSFLVTSKVGNDERVYDTLKQDIVESGTIRDDDFRFIAIPENDTLYTRDVEFNAPFSVLKKVTGTIYHIETSNLPDKPFIFIYQRNPDNFVEYDKETWRTFSTPTQRILTIRVDDLL